MLGNIITSCPADCSSLIVAVQVLVQLQYACRSPGERAHSCGGIALLPIAIS
jgi:hypothetical protein